ncbi:trehalose operon repressor [Listeria grandensis]|uniref:Trehalose operon repressor n=1 Tax=Listeria grandensis TaxID=1494963 RepID=A0A7X0Y652_9LIST|nr:trehalose operon repressor [Listeria grandensis]MBC1937752.1 trehalose operon repressor [Listeria grandensis]MBC6316702.1 trehalose operon repressor [Listeria grandensis]
MGKAVYHDIYVELKKDIDNERYAFKEMLPTEHALAGRFDCSRNTVRRAISELVKDGYVQSVRGKGVMVIHQHESIEFMFGGVESMKESLIRNHKTFQTKVVHFEELEVDAALSAKTWLPVGTQVYYIKRLRFVENEALILDVNYFDRNVVRNLTPERAAESIYEYIEEELRVKIVTSKRYIVVEKALADDKQYLDLAGYDCLAVVKNYAYDANGTMFEYTESRHRPDRFVFFDSAQRLK